jgi:hypothetical protein
MVAAIFIAIVAVVVFFQRRPLAQVQAGILGGSVVPGCVVAEAIVLLLIAVAMFVFSQ